MQQDHNELLSRLFADLIAQNLRPEINDWLQEKAGVIGSEAGTTQLNLVFAIVPRKTGRQGIVVSPELANQLGEVHPQFQIADWSIDRLCRVWILLQVESADRESYLKKLENLFLGAEMNELVALYSALIGFRYQSDWKNRCAEGIRSNIDGVLKAIMYDNPYPYRFLNEQAWNQLVMKAFFTEKDVTRIIGLDERANPELAAILVDYADERRSAHRKINPQLWRLVAPFVNEGNLGSIEAALKGGDPDEQKAAAIACHKSNFPDARNLLESYPNLKKETLQANRG